MDTPTSTEEALVTWSAPITPHYHRTMRWYVIAFIIIALCVTYGILNDSLPFAAVAILVGIVYALLHRHAPPDRTITFTALGVTLKSRSLAWTELKGFWLLRTPDYTELHLIPSAPRSADLIIQTGMQNIETLRALLQTRLPELTDRKERMIDTFIRICKL